MLRRVRFALTPGWLGLHMLCLALVVTMVLLGRWQLDVSNSKHFSLQNFGYALQWWSFSAFVIVMWLRLLRDARRQEGAGAAAGQSSPTEGASAPHIEVPYRRYVMPSSADVTKAVDDPTRAAYNDYLAALAERDARDRSAEGHAAEGRPTS